MTQIKKLRKATEKNRNRPETEKQVGRLFEKIDQKCEI